MHMRWVLPINRVYSGRVARAFTTYRIVTYNVLSSRLAEPDYFTHCNSEYLDADYRMNLLTKKIDTEVSRNSIICLQEVSAEWAGKLYMYFASKKYNFIPALYGNRFDGNMGVAIAFSSEHYDVTGLDITRIADTKKYPLRRQIDETFLTKAIDFFNGVLSNITSGYRIVKPRTSKTSEEVVWQEALRRQNQMICASLTNKSNGQSFIVGNYHMPCVFRTPQVMTIHCSLAAQHLQRLSRNIPYVLAGDFNIKPGSTMHQVLTKGRAEGSEIGCHPEVPDAVPGDNWRAEVQPMRSAYVDATGSEPDFTNHARVRNEEPFIDTLDYIFLSRHWKVQSVEPLPHRDSVGGPLPNRLEPSDHILLAADIVLDDEAVVEIQNKG